MNPRESANQVYEHNSLPSNHQIETCSPDVKQENAAALQECQDGPIGSEQIQSSHHISSEDEMPQKESSDYWIM